MAGGEWHHVVGTFNGSRPRIAEHSPCCLSKYDSVFNGTSVPSQLHAADRASWCLDISHTVLCVSVVSFLRQSKCALPRSGCRYIRPLSRNRCLIEMGEWNREMNQPYCEMNETVVSRPKVNPIQPALEMKGERRELVFNRRDWIPASSRENNRVNTAQRPNEY